MAFGSGRGSIGHAIYIDTSDAITRHYTSLYQHTLSFLISYAPSLAILSNYRGAHYLEHEYLGVSGTWMDANTVLSSTAFQVDCDRNSVTGLENHGTLYQCELEPAGTLGRFGATGHHVIHFLLHEILF